MNIQATYFLNFFFILQTRFERRCVENRQNSNGGAYRMDARKWRIPTFEIQKIKANPSDYDVRIGIWRFVTAFFPHFFSLSSSLIKRYFLLIGKKRIGRKMTCFWVETRIYFQMRLYCRFLRTHSYRYFDWLFCLFLTAERGRISLVSEIESCSRHMNYFK